jgi:hypothetical protein
MTSVVEEETGREKDGITEEVLIELDTTGESLCKIIERPERRKANKTFQRCKLVVTWWFCT